MVSPVVNTSTKTVANIANIANIGVIGTGALGQRLIKNLVEYQSSDLLCSYRRESHRQMLAEKFPSIILTDDLKRIASESNVLIIAVKPKDVVEVCRQINSSLSNTTIVFSMAAVISLSTLTKELSSTPLIGRCMPNIMMSTGYGLYGIYSASSNVIEQARTTFHPNELVVFDTENELNDSTILIGCAPALIAWYVSLLPKSLMTKISAEKMTFIINRTLQGIGEEMKESTLSNIIHDVSSPNGFTEAILKQFESEGVDSQVRSILLQNQNLLRDRCHSA